MTRAGRPPHLSTAASPPASGARRTPRCGMDFRSSPPCRRGATDRAAASFSPTTAMYGIFSSSALRILAPSLSELSSSSTRQPWADEAPGGLAGPAVEAVRDGDQPGLHRCQPGREGAGVVLGEDGDEALERAVDGAVDHHRPVLLVVVADVGEIEALGRGVVELDGAGLPGAAQRVGHGEVDLGAVEGAVAGVELPGQPQPRPGPRAATPSALSQRASSPTRSAGFAGRVEKPSLNSSPKAP